MSSIARLKKQIEKLTGKHPGSADVRYLIRRLQDLEARAAAGEELRSERHENISVSMSSSAKAALARILEREKGGVSALVRRALADWALLHGHDAEANALGGPDWRAP